MQAEPESPNPAAGDSGFPIVGIGASAGGLEALDEFLEHMPADSGIAFVVVTHQHPGHTSLLPDLLGRETTMAVSVAEEATRLEPNHIYIAPPGCQLAILNGTLHRMDGNEQAAPKFPVDYFFRSLAEDQQERAICIVLSGNGTDGTLGLQAIKEGSGMAIVQQPRSAKYAGMPSSAEGTGLVDYVLPPAEMPQHLIAYTKNLSKLKIRTVAEPSVELTEPIQKIFLLLRHRTGHDFSGYKSNTIKRRIARRMNLHQIDDVENYLLYLNSHEEEVDALFDELLISVTSFFRDPDSWEALASGPLMQMLQSRPEDTAIRAWVPGCATGEEVYTLAIILRECLAKCQRHLEVQIFGTDLDGRAIDVARRGTYPCGIASDVSPERLEKYFAKEDSSYRICREIREMAVFALQNVIRDPPFTKLDILSCRNLLIYLDSDLQKQLLPIFHYALKPGGLLFLGPSETIGGSGDLFETVDREWKIFRCEESAIAVQPVPQTPISALPDPGRTSSSSSPPPPPVRNKQIRPLIERLALDRLCPAFVVINDRGDILHVHGHTGKYLELAEGQARTNLLDMARKGLPHRLASAIREATHDPRKVVRDCLRVKTNHDYSEVSITVMSIPDPEPIRGLLMVTFQQETERPAGGATVPASPPSPVQEDVEALESELRFLRESYQTTLEELETSNEELKSANEEMQSTNEEMQSTNEELETSKEETQSLNEELTTVNAELRSKVEDLSHANNDLQNLLNSTEVATIFLDNEFKIKRYTEPAKAIIKLRITDIGRPLGELASDLESVDLLADCREVLDTLIFKKREVESKGGDWFLMRILPYRTTDRVVDGLVLTFVSISEIKEAEHTGEQRALFEAIFETVRQPLLVLDDRQVAISANRSFYQLFRVRPDEVIGQRLTEIGGGEFDISALKELVEETLPGSVSYQDFKLEHEFSKIGHRSLLLNARCLRPGDRSSGLVLLAIEDVTGNPAEGEQR